MEQNNMSILTTQAANLKYSSFSMTIKNILFSMDSYKNQLSMYIVHSKIL